MCGMRASRAGLAGPASLRARRAKSCAIAMAIGLGVSAAGFAQAQAPRSLIITEATLIDGTGAAPQANTAIHIDNGVITRIDAVRDGRYPTGPNVVSARGKFIVPGLV